MVNQVSTAKPVLKLCTQKSRYQNGASSTSTNTPTKAGKGPASSQFATPDGKSIGKEGPIVKPVWVTGNLSKMQHLAVSKKGQFGRAGLASDGCGDSSPAMSKPGDSDKRSRVSGTSLSLSTSLKRGVDRPPDMQGNLSTSMTSMKLLALSSVGSTPSKAKSAQISHPKLNGSQQLGDDASPLSSSSLKGQLGAVRTQTRAQQASNPAPNRALDIPRGNNSAERALNASKQGRLTKKLDATPLKTHQGRLSTKLKPTTSGTIFENMKVAASASVLKRSKSTPLDGDPDKPNSTGVRKSMLNLVTPVKRSPSAASAISAQKARLYKDSEAKAGASLNTGVMFGTRIAALQHRNFPRQSVDYEAQVQAEEAAVPTPRPVPRVPRLNLAAVLSQSQELHASELPHHQPDAVLSPSGRSARSHSTATALPSRHSKTSSGSMALGTPQEDHFYMYKSVTPEERRQWEALIKRLPRTESKQVKKLWDALLDARHNCEGMAFRGHRLLDQMKNDFLQYKAEAEKKLAEVEFDRQRLGVLLQSKEAQPRGKSKGGDTTQGRDQGARHDGQEEPNKLHTSDSTDSADWQSGAHSEGSDELAYRARIIATSETAHILMRQLMEKEAIQHDLQNQVTDLQKLVYCLANIAKHLLNEQPAPRPSPTHLSQWREFVNKLLQQAAYQAAQGRATGGPPAPSPAPSPVPPRSPHAHTPRSAGSPPPTPRPSNITSPPQAPRYHSPRDDLIPRAEAFSPSNTPTAPSVVSSPDDMDYSPGMVSTPPSMASSPPASTPTMLDMSGLSPFSALQQGGSNFNTGGNTTPNSDSGPFLVPLLRGVARNGADADENQPSTGQVHKEGVQHAAGFHRNVDSHYLDLDQGGTSTPADCTSTEDGSPGELHANNSGNPRYEQARKTVCSPEPMVTTPSHVQLGASTRNLARSPPPMKSPVPPLRLTNLNLRDRLETLDVPLGTDRSASLTAPSTLTTPNSPSQLFYPAVVDTPTIRSPSHHEQSLRTHIQDLISRADGNAQLNLGDSEPNEPVGCGSDSSVLDCIGGNNLTGNLDISTLSLPNQPSGVAPSDAGSLSSLPDPPNATYPASGEYSTADGREFNDDGGFHTTDNAASGVEMYSSIEASSPPSAEADRRPNHATSHVKQRPFPQSNPMFLPYTRPAQSASQSPTQTANQTPVRSSQSSFDSGLARKSTTDGTLAKQLSASPGFTRPSKIDSGLTKPSNFDSTLTKQSSSESGSESGFRMVSQGMSGSPLPGRLASLRNDLQRLKLSTEARIQDVERLVGGVGGRSGVLRVQEEVESEEEPSCEAEPMHMDSIELPLPHSNMPNSGINAVQLA